MTNDKYRGPCLYRGKRVDSGEWIEGCFVDCYNELDGGELRGFKNIIFDKLGNPIEIDPETLSAWTGLEDKNGVKIFGGDVVDFEEQNWAVEWDKDSAQFTLKEPSVVLNFNDHLDGASCEVIGNIWDNPELEELTVCEVDE